MKIHRLLAILFSLMLSCFQTAAVAQEEVSSYAMDAQGMLEALKTFTSSDLLDELATNSTATREGKDEDLRPLFVNLQTDFERAIVYWLKTKQIQKCVCIIHTPAPATPLCTSGEISEGLVDPAIASDPKRLLTVKNRPDIIREYLHEGGSLLAVYPQKGRLLRSQEQLAILSDLLQKYPKLEAIELEDQIPNDLIGATCLIRSLDSKEYVLSFRSYQANSPTDGKWAVWFGSIQNPAIRERFESVVALLFKRTENQSKLDLKPCLKALS